MTNVIVFLALMFTIVSSILVKNDPIEPQLKLIVTVDGKSYFGDRTVVRNWTESGEYCTSLGMHMASITSKLQWDALDSAYDSTDFDRGYWTSGRDALHRQFTWNVTGSELSSEYLVFSSNQVFVDYQTCIMYWSVAGNNTSSLVYHMCSEARGTLCET